MKRIFTFLLISMTLLTGCESYLDRMPDDPMSFEAIWKKQGDVLKYLLNIYGYLPDDGNYNHNFSQSSVSDEGSSTYQNLFTADYIYETWNPESGIYTELYQNPYRGIHEASVFIENVDKCTELSAQEIAQYKAEAQYLRSYYYFCILRYYGPVFFNGSNSTDCLDDDVYTADRTKWDVFEEFILHDMDEAIVNLLDEHDEINWLGRITKSTALALKARLLLYSARPLFNGQVILGEGDEVTPTHMYDNIKNNKGEQIFNTKYDKNRWKKAADAARAMIDYAELNNRFELHQVEEDDDPSVHNENDLLRGLKNLNSLYVGARMNKEFIFTYQKAGGGARQATTPANLIDQFTAAWSSLGPTYKMVDAFAMANGVYPVKTEHWCNEEAYQHGKNVNVRNNNHVDSRAKQAGYAETGGAPYKNPLFVATSFNSDVIEIKAMDTPQQFINREARFYRNIAWSGMQWIAGGAKIMTEDGAIEFYQGGLNGYPNAHDIPPTGFIATKFYDPTLNLKTTGWGTYTFPIFRLAGVYLDYIEALNEWDPNHPDILKYWNKIRYRAGVPNIEEIYPDIVGVKHLQREYIRRERMVEMAFESQRLMDTRTWMIAEQTNDGYIIGCMQKAGTDEIDSDYWKRVEVAKEEYSFGDSKRMGPRKFSKKSYLLPIPTYELNRVPSLRNSQNLGW